MQLTSPAFFTFLAIGILLFNLSDHLEWRRSVLLLLSLVFLTSQSQVLSALLPVVAFIVLSALVILAVSATRSRPVFIISLTVVVASFVYLKQYAFINFVNFLSLDYSVIGLSYIFFRVIHLLVDTYQGALSVSYATSLSLTTYLCSFLTFLAGPIQRFEDFRKQEAALGTHRITEEIAFSSFSRIATGYLKIVIFAEVFRHAHLHLAELPVQAPGVFVLSAFAFLLFIYLNFSGYMDVVIGLGRLFGFRLPENFNSPLAARNFIDVWNRWHITLSQSFKTYLFNPIMKGAASRWGETKFVTYFGVAAYFVVFFLLGLWHGSGYMFVILGIMLAFGVSANKLFEIEMRRRLGTARLKVLQSHRLYRALARSAALTYLAVCLTPAWPGHQAPVDLVRLLGDLGPSGVLANAALAVLALFLVQLVAEPVALYGRRLADQMTSVSGSLLGREAWLSLKVFVAGFAIFGTANSDLPDVVYRGF